MLKKKDKESLRHMSIGELQKMATDIRFQLSRDSVERFTKQPKNTRGSKALRKKLATVLTFLSEAEVIGKTV